MDENKSSRKNKTRKASNDALEPPSKSKRPKTTVNKNLEKTAEKTMMAWDLASPHSDSTDDDEGHSSEAQPSTSQNSLPKLTIPDQSGAEVDCTEELEQIEDLLDEGKEKIYSTAVDDSIALPWEVVTATGLTATQRKDFKENNPIAENLSMLEAPAVNPELTKLVLDKIMKRDKIMQGHQELLGRATASLGVAIDKLIKTNGNRDVINALKETGKQLCDLFNINNNARRSFLQFALDKETSTIIKPHKTGGKLLFGEKLTDNLEICKKIIHSLSKDKLPTKPAPKSKLVPKPYHVPTQVFVPPPLAPPGIRPSHPAPAHPPLPRDPGPSHASFRPRAQGPRHRGSGHRGASRGYQHQSYRPRRGHYHT